MYIGSDYIKKKVSKQRRYSCASPTHYTYFSVALRSFCYQGIPRKEIILRNRNTPRGCTEVYFASLSPKKKANENKLLENPSKHYIYFSMNDKIYAK